MKSPFVIFIKLAGESQTKWGLCRQFFFNILKDNIESCCKGCQKNCAKIRVLFILLPIVQNGTKRVTKWGQNLN